MSRYYGEFIWVTRYIYNTHTVYFQKTLQTIWYAYVVKSYMGFIWFIQVFNGYLHDIWVGSLSKIIQTFAQELRTHLFHAKALTSIGQEISLERWAQHRITYLSPSTCTSTLFPSPLTVCPLGNGDVFDSFHCLSSAASHRGLLELPSGFWCVFFAHLIDNFLIQRRRRRRPVKPCSICRDLSISRSLAQRQYLIKLNLFVSFNFGLKTAKRAQAAHLCCVS